MNLHEVVEKSILAPQYESQEYVDIYLKIHMKRFVETVNLLQQIARPHMRVIDVGSYGSLVPALKDVLGFEQITITEPHQDKQPRTEEATLQNARNSQKYPFVVDRFDLEGPFPYANGTFDIVIFTEVLEHLAVDPVHTLSEINRITRMGGWLLVSTPNCASTKSVLNILRGRNPNLYPVYTKQPSRDRHNREYVPWEVRQLLFSTGYDVTSLEAVDVYEDSYKGEAGKLFIRTALRIACLLFFKSINVKNRGDTIFALGRKIAGVKERYPAFLYV